MASHVHSAPSLPFPSLTSHKPSRHVGSQNGGHSHSHSGGMPLRFLSLRSLTRSQNLRALLRLFWSTPDSKRVLVFLFILLSFSVTKLVMGIWTGHRDLMVSCFDTIFNSASLIVALLAVAAARSQSSSQYSYGYARFETVAGLINTLYLFYTSFSMSVESLHHYFTPPDLLSETEAFVCLLGLCVNLVGIGLFNQYRTLEDYNVGFNGFVPRSQGAHESNMHGCFLHAACSSILLVSSLIRYLWSDQFDDIAIANFTISIVSAILIARLALPLFKRTASILLQTVPEPVSRELDQSVRKINTSEGVLECRQLHWWSQSPSDTIGSLHVRVRSDADEQSILNMVTLLLGRFITNLTVQIDKDQNVML